MADITWNNTRVRLGELIPWSRNPKTISKVHAKRLLEYWDKLGQFQSIAVSESGDVYDGHQRLSVLLAAHGKDYEVDARQSSRLLSEKEREELVIAAHVGTVGQFDWEQLSNWDAPELIAWGVDSDAVADWRHDASAAEMMLITEGVDVKDGFDFGSLPDEDRAPFRQVTFTLHDSQYEQVAEALKVSKGMGAFDSENENSNGNAIARICEVFLTEHGNG